VADAAPPEHLAAPPPSSDGHAARYAETVGPTELHDPVVVKEAKRAMVWIALVVAVVLVALLAQPLLLIVGALVIAALLDGGTRLIGRLLPLPRGIRLALVVVIGVGFVTYVVAATGAEMVAQARALAVIVELQAARLSALAGSLGLSVGLDDVKDFSGEIFNSIGRVTAVVTSAVGAVASLVMMLVLAIFIAAEPRLYERGLAWMVPLSQRDYFYGTLEHMGATLRRLLAGRLLGMLVEGVSTWLLLALGGVPMAALLGMITGLFAFLPNIGAIISGLLIVLVGFSAGTDTGIYAVIVYLIVQAIDGYVIIPMVAKRAVDLAPALVLGAQILLGALLGIMGLFLADPIVAMIKVALEREAERNAGAADPIRSP